MLKIFYPTSLSQQSRINVLSWMHSYLSSLGLYMWTVIFIFVFNDLFQFEIPVAFIDNLRNFLYYDFGFF